MGQVYTLTTYYEFLFKYPNEEIVPKYLNPGCKIEGVLTPDKSFLVVKNAVKPKTIPVSILEEFQPTVTKPEYSKQFTLEQLYKLNTVVVPENAEQASELLTWFKSTGYSSYSNTTPENVNYCYNKTYYHLFKNVYGNATILPRMINIINWSDIPDTIKEQPMADFKSYIQTTSNTSTVWINPKPKKPNTQPISVNSLCLVHSYPFPLTCTYISDNLYHLKQPDGATVIFNNLKEVYPLTELKQTGYKVGDILNIDDTWIVYTGDNSVPLNYKSLKSYRPNYPTNGSETLVQNLTKFSCGTLICSKTKQVVTDNISESQTIITDSPIPYEHFKIKEHYSIDKIQAKDEELFKELQITLDHPLNVESKEFALLVGPSGSGKTELAIQYANSRNLPYIKMQITSQTTVDDYIGYKSITTGKYFPSLLREAVEKGHTLILDELDAGNPNSTLVLNGLKQSHFQFPDKLVPIHSDFRLIATANTLEYSEQYNSRMPMDKATLDRFHIINYDMKDHHLAIRYGLDYIKQIETKDKTPRQIEREVRQLKIHNELKQTNYYN